MAYSKDSIEVDKRFWFDNDLVSHDFAPEVNLNIFKKLFSKFMFFILKRVMK